MTVGNDADAGLTSDRGATPESLTPEAFLDRVYQAIERDDAAELRRLAAGRPGWRGGDVFHDAVRLGSVECVRVLLGLGNRADGPDECCGTPLAYAATQGSLALVKLLVEAGADPNALAEDFEPEISDDCWHQTPLFWAALAGHDEVAEYLAPLTRPDLRARLPELLRRRREQEERFWSERG